MSQLRYNPILMNIIHEIDTEHNRISAPHRRKWFEVNKRIIDIYGWKDWNYVVTTLKALQQHISVDIKYSDSLQESVTKFAVYTDDLFTIQTLYNGETSQNRLANIREIVSHYKSLACCEWLKQIYYQPYLDRIKKGKIITNFNSDRTFHLLLNAIIQNESPIYMRAFSTKILGNSKKFEKEYLKAVCPVLRKCPDLKEYEESIDESLSNNDVLRYFGIQTYNNTFEFKGNITYSLDQKSCLSTEKEEYGSVWNTEMLIHGEIQEVHAKQIITIENKANFYAVPHDPDTLYIFVHGFLSPLEQKICKQIFKSAPDAKYYHFGDLDYGGIRIFEFLKNKIFPTIKPLKMDVDTFREYEKISPGEIISSDVRKKLAAMTVSAELQPLKDHILSTWKIYEQETFILIKK